MALRVSRGVLAIVVIVAVLGAGIYAAVYFLLRKAEPFTMGEHCAVTTPDGGLDLDLEQAQVAATIAAVAARRRLPERAVQIAYVTAIQESKLLNLPYGDRDSVGVFQQRPSQGWGTKKQLLDTVYATRKFYSALEKIKRYRTLPLHEAAQAVQRSADGSAYADHEQDAKILAGAFTGRVPKSVHCWYPASQTPAPSRTDAARRQLARALGGTAGLADPAGAQASGGQSVLQVDASNARRGWLIASWAVAHAQRYGLRHVRYAGVSWTSASGQEGWRTEAKASPGLVELAKAVPMWATAPGTGARARQGLRAAARS